MIGHSLLQLGLNMIRWEIFNLVKWDPGLPIQGWNFTSAFGAETFPCNRNYLFNRDKTIGKTRVWRGKPPFELSLSRFLEV